MSENMVERVADAILDCDIALTNSEARTYAAAAIKAMREPTEAMLVKCWPHHHPWGENCPSPDDRPNGYAAMRDLVTKDWRACIDAALTEKDKDDGR